MEVVFSDSASIQDIFIIMQEIWKDIKWYEWKYQVSNLGKIKSFWYWKCNLLSQWKTKYWYLTIVLVKNIKKTFSVHRLVAEAFIPNTDNKPCVNHINWVKSDNRIENLEWVTYSENIKHSYMEWLRKVTENNNFYKKNPVRWKFWKSNWSSKKITQYSISWDFIKEWDSIMDVERELWINDSSIWKCCIWKYRHAWGFIWRFK